MTNTELLNRKIADSGKKRGYLACKCGLSRTWFNMCVNNLAEFKTSHVKILCYELNITDLAEKEAIFYATVDSYVNHDEEDNT